MSLQVAIKALEERKRIVQEICDEELRALDRAIEILANIDKPATQNEGGDILNDFMFR